MIQYTLNYFVYTPWCRWSDQKYYCISTHPNTAFCNFSCEILPQCWQIAKAKSSLGSHQGISNCKGNCKRCLSSQRPGWVPMRYRKEIPGICQKSNNIMKYAFLSLSFRSTFIHQFLKLRILILYPRNLNCLKYETLLWFYKLLCGVISQGIGSSRCQRQREVFCEYLQRTRIEKMKLWRLNCIWIEYSLIFRNFVLLFFPIVILKCIQVLKKTS